MNKHKGGEEGDDIEEQIEKNQIMKGYLKWTWYSVMGVFIPKSKILVTTPKI